MARLSMPARKSRASTSSASSSSRKVVAGSKKRLGSDDKPSLPRHYASVLVGELFDKLVEERLPEIKKNRNTVTKWLSKARMSVLKKISESSRTIFSEALPDYSQKIAELRGEIRELRSKIVEAANERIKLSIAVQETSNIEVQDPGFAPKISSIGGKITQVAHQMDALGKDLQARSQAFGSTYAVVESSWAEKSKQVAAEGARRSTRTHAPPSAAPQPESLASIISAPLSPSSDAVLMELLGVP